MTAKIYRGRYEALALVARGGQGEVWRACDRVHGRDVALKIRRAPAGERDRLLSETRTLLFMRPHPGLPIVRDDFFTGQRYVIVMDWIEGTNLDHAPELPFEEVMSRLSEVAEALDHLHSHDPPILHGDVKPANIILTREGRAVLVDFGLAGDSSGGGGTPGFVAPEVVRGDEATTASDVFGLAVTALLLLTGAAPVPGSEPDWARVPSGLRDQIRTALGAALAIDPRLRPAGASALVTSLRPPHTPNNLPAQLSSFVGRELVGAEVRGKLGQTRLLTLVGPGGCGKTRLVLRVAQSALPSFDGVWLAELARISDPAFVVDGVARALGIQPERGRDVAESLTSFLITGTQLLVLDNCEHVVDASAHLVERLLRASPELRILTTSREPLRASGELVLTVPPMDEDEAVRLFSVRAQRTEEQDAAVIARICKRLDGIPLAVELAAARSFTTGLEELDQRLDEALGLLTGGARTVPRQETLRATIDWSHELLSGDERSALWRLSVFAGGFTSDAAWEACSVDDELDRLVDASLLTRAGGRLRMLETVRQYAAEKLAGTGQGTEAHGRHARWFAGFVERASAELMGASQRDWLERLEAEHDNLQAALGYAVAEEPHTAARIAGSAFQYWLRRGHWNEGREWVERAIAASPSMEPGPLGSLLVAAGFIAQRQGELDPARIRLEQAVALGRRTGDQSLEARARGTLAVNAYERGDYGSARSLYEECIALGRARGDTLGVAVALNNLANLLFALGEDGEGAAALEEGLAIRRELGDKAGIAGMLGNLAVALVNAGNHGAARLHWTEALAIAAELGDEQRRSNMLYNLGMLDVIEGDVGSARAVLTESHEITRRLGFRAGEAQSLHGLGEAARVDGDLDGAAELHAEALSICRRLGDPRLVAESLEGLAVTEGTRGDFALAARLLGESHVLREAGGTAVQPHMRAEVERRIKEARDALGEEAFLRAWDEGRATVASESVE